MLAQTLRLYLKLDTVDFSAVPLPLCKICYTSNNAMPDVQTMVYPRNSMAARSSLSIYADRPFLSKFEVSSNE